MTDELTKWLRENDYDLEDLNSVTALMYCASAGKEEFVKLLLEHKAKADIESLDGFKAIDLAVTSKIVKLLKNASIS